MPRKARKKRKKSELEEFLKSAEDGLEESKKKGEVITTMTISMTNMGDPVDSILNEMISLLNSRVDFLEGALWDLVNMHYKCRRARKRG